MTEPKTTLRGGFGRFADVCERIDYGFTASADFSISEPRLLRITDIQDGSVEWGKVPGCTITPKEEEENRLLVGDVVFARTGATTGKSFLIRHAPRAVFASYLIRLRMARDVLPEYFAAFCQSDLYWQQVNKEMRGSAQAGVNSTLLGSLVLPVPDRAEQKRIAAILERADRLRRLRRYGLETAETFLPTAFLRVFGDPVVNPNHWPVVCLGDTIERFEGGVNFNPVENNAPASEWRVLKVSAVSTGEFLSRESKPISPETTFEDSLIVRRGDIIMSRANTVELVGAICRVREHPPKVLLPDKLWRVRLPDNAKVHPDFLLQCMRMPSIRYQVGLVCSGTSGSMKNISKGDAGSIRIPLPPLTLQEKFADLVEWVERVLRCHRESLRQAEHLFQALLKRAFTGGL